MLKVKTVVIAGSSSRVGKTTFIEWLLNGLSGWSALKVTILRKGGCPRDTSCSICDNLSSEYEIITNPTILSQKGTDTARFIKAGAVKVIWLKSTLKGLSKGLKKAISKFKRTKGLIIEGTSVLKHIKPDLIFFLRGPSNPRRLPAKAALKKADIVVYGKGS